MATPNSAPVTSLYVHVPFCAQKCAYCAFYSEASSGALMNRYTDALILELETLAPGLRPQTIFFGGGTPSLLTLSQWERLLEAMRRLNLLGAAEWTVECNPATVSLEKARLLRSAGVNRVSMGVQSFDDDLLERLGRIHSRQMIFTSWDTLRQAGFDNLNLDLMFAIPGQTIDVWRRTLAEALALQSEHLSCYEVIYEEDTPLFHQLQAGHVREDEDLACAMYDELVQTAATHDFVQYEVANFARNDTAATAEDPAIPSRACRHNVNYWRGGDFQGAGPSATSYVGGVRTKNFSNTQLYCEQLEKGNRPFEMREQLPPLARAGETAAFGLRMVAGWPFDSFLQVTGHDLRAGWSDEMDQLVAQGWGRRAPDRFHLTSEGLRFADNAAQLFLR